MPYTMAAKLVMKCRRIGLLEKTEPRRAGGVKSGSSPDESDQRDET